MLKYGIWDNLTLYSGHGRFYLFQNKLSLTPFEVRSVFCVLIYFASYVQRLQSAQLPLVPVDLQLGNTSDRSVCQGGCSSWQLRSKRKMKIGYQQPFQRHFPSGQLSPTRLHLLKVVLLTLRATGGSPNLKHMSLWGHLISKS